MAIGYSMRMVESCIARGREWHKLFRRCMSCLDVEHAIPHICMRLNLRSEHVVSFRLFPEPSKHSLATRPAIVDPVHVVSTSSRSQISIVGRWDETDS